MTIRPNEKGDGSNPIPEGIPRNDYRRQFWFKEFGIRLPPWKDESEAPPVDEDLLRASREGKLGQEAELRLTRLILLFRTWASAYCRIGRERRKESDAEC